MSQKKLIRMSHITRDYIRAHPDWCFLFGDNLQHEGLGGQAAEMRDEPNTIGVPTKCKPAMTRDAFFSDGDLKWVKPLYDFIFAAIRAFPVIVIPVAGLGTGFAELPRRAPLIHLYLEKKIRELGNDRECETLDGK